MGYSGLWKFFSFLLVPDTDEEENAEQKSEQFEKPELDGEWEAILKHL